MNTTLTKKQIDSIYNSIRRAMGYSRELDETLDTIKAEERRHRKGRPDSLAGERWKHSVPTIAKFIFIRLVAQDMLGSKPPPELKDIFSLLLSLYQTYALVEIHREKLASLSIDWQQYTSLSYFDMMH